MRYSWDHETKICNIWNERLIEFKTTELTLKKSRKLVSFTNQAISCITRKDHKELLGFQKLFWKDTKTKFLHQARRNQRRNSKSKASNVSKNEWWNPSGPKKTTTPATTPSEKSLWTTTRPKKTTAHFFPASNVKCTSPDRSSFLTLKTEHTWMTSKASFRASPSQKPCSHWGRRSTRVRRGRRRVRRCHRWGISRLCPVRLRLRSEMLRIRKKRIRK